MQIKVKTINNDGSVAFEGFLNEQQVQAVLEVGVNFLMAQGIHIISEPKVEKSNIITV